MTGNIKCVGAGRVAFYDLTRQLDVEAELGRRCFGPQRKRRSRHYVTIILLTRYCRFSPGVVYDPFSLIFPVKNITGFTSQSKKKNTQVLYTQSHVALVRADRQTDRQTNNNNNNSNEKRWKNARHRLASRLLERHQTIPKNFLKLNQNITEVIHFSNSCRRRPIGLISSRVSQWTIPLFHHAQFQALANIATFSKQSCQQCLPCCLNCFSDNWLCQTLSGDEIYGKNEFIPWSCVPHRLLQLTVFFTDSHPTLKKIAKFQVYGIPLLKDLFTGTRTRKSIRPILNNLH